MSGPSTQPTNLGDARNVKRDVSRRTMARASSSRPDETRHTTHTSTHAPPRPRGAEEERARAAAKQAEKEMWEKTRGAGSSVFKLAETQRIRRSTFGNADEWKAEDVLAPLEEVENKVYDVGDVRNELLRTSC
jgi:hypothetical protein